MRRTVVAPLSFQSRRGMTILESIVAASIIGLLLALIIPAVQSVRESSRRLQCQVNLSQLGRALHAHQAVHQFFPRGGDMVLDGTGGAWPRAHSPHLYLLPYLDESNRFGTVDLRVPAHRDLYGFPGPHDVNQPAQEAVLAVFRCPSDPGAPVSHRNSYRANVGVTAYPRGYNNPQDVRLAGYGAFAPPRDWVGPQNFPDGLATTAAFSEKLMGDGSSEVYTSSAEHFELSEVTDPNTVLFSTHADADHVFWCGQLHDSSPLHDSTAGEFWFFAGFQDTWYNHLLTPNHAIPDCATVTGLFGGGVFTARSAHPGGVNCVMLDGSVRFVSDGVDSGVWSAVGTRNGQEVIGTAAF